MSNENVPAGTQKQDFTELARLAGIKFGKGFVYSDYTALTSHIFSTATLARFAALVVQEHEKTTLTAQPAAPAVPFGEMPRPAFGQVGTKDVEVAELQRRWDEAHATRSSQRTPLPKSNSDEAAQAMDIVLRERKFPANPGSAARCGFEAAYRMATLSSQRTPLLTGVELDLSKGDSHRHPDINLTDDYLCQIGDCWFMGRFSEQWYGLNFHGWTPNTGAGLQYDKPGTNSSSWKRVVRLVIAPSEFPEALVAKI